MSQSTPNTAGTSNSTTPAATTGTSQQERPLVVINRGRSWFSWLGWTGFFTCAVMLIGNGIFLSDYFNSSEGITEKYVSGGKFATDKVAVIQVTGVIMDGEGYVKKQIDRVMEDDNVKAVVLRVDSPGGTVTGSDYILHHLNELRNEKKIPIIVSMGSMAASGGYYVSMAVGDQKDSIFAEPTTTTGSIGVIIPHYDVSGLMAKYDVKDDSIASHPRKQMLSMTRPISEENRELIQAYVDSSFEMFKEKVRSGRPAYRDKAGKEKLDELATGEIYTAKQAKELGLVDEIGFLEDAIDRALEVAELKEEDTRVIKFNRPAGSLLDIALGSAKVETPKSEIAELLQFSAPKGWFLSMPMPAAIAMPRAE